MSPTLSDQVPSRRRVERKLAAAQYQIGALEAIPDEADRVVAIESCTSAAIDQMLQALAATLDGFNRQLLDPLPPLRVNRRNLRDEFYAVESECRLLREIENAARVRSGWLWWLEQKHVGGPFGPLVDIDAGFQGGQVALLRDPLDPEAGVEGDPPAAYLQSSLDRMIKLIDRIGALAADDVAAYRAGSRGQSRPMM